MRRCIAAAIVTLSLGTGVIFHASSLAQEQPEGTRKVLTRVLPVYPEVARKMQLRGTVKLEVVVAPNGKVKSTQVIGGSPVLVRAGTDAIEKWRWAVAPQDTKELIELNFHPE